MHLTKSLKTYVRRILKLLQQVTSIQTGAKTIHIKIETQATLNDNGLNQIVTEYTRVTENTKTLIDFVITNSINVSAKTNGENKIADHKAIDINIKNKNFIESTKKEIEIFKYNKNLFITEVRNNTDKNENKSLSEMTYNIDNCFENAKTIYNKENY